jgi:hypothetical protein
VQLHQEERNYLVQCHKERISRLKGELDASQTKLKAISQQYRDEQERWSNAREREETRFANMRKRLDLQIKNKRNLVLQIKALRERLEQAAPEEPAQPVGIITSEPEKEPEPEHEVLTAHAVSDRVHQLRQRIRTAHPNYADVAALLDDVAHLVDQDRLPTKTTRELFPAIFRALSSIHSGRVRSVEWLMAALTYFYAKRLGELSSRRQVFPYPTNRQHIALSIYEQLLAGYGTPLEAAEVFFDVVETAKGLSNAGNKRCVTFLRFIDAEQPYLDSVYLDFYCFCLGSFAVSNTATTHLFPDVFDGDVPQFGVVPGAIACDIARKVLSAVSEAGVAEKALSASREQLGVDGDCPICQDDVLEFLLDFYAKEEAQVTDQLKEQYDMDAAQYGGIATFGQFQTLVLFSARKLDWRLYPEMMREAMRGTLAKRVSFADLMAAMHRYAMLIPFTFDRIEYEPETRLDDILGFMRHEYEEHLPTITTLLEKTRKDDDTIFKRLTAAKAKFVQVLETKRTGSFTEVAQRELYALIRTINVE